MQASKVFDYGTVYRTTFKIIMSILTNLLIIIMLMGMYPILIKIKKIFII